MSIFKHIVILIFFCITLNSCSKREHTENCNSRNFAETAFTEKYPGEKAKKWRSENSYMIAEAKIDGHKCESWFDRNGWIMTIAQISLSNLPQPTLNAFQKSGYFDWELTGCRKIDRKDRETIYVLDVERNKVKFDLYYNGRGILVRSVNATDSKRECIDFLPRAIPAPVLSEMKKTHPNAVIFEVVSNTSTYIIDIIDEGKGKKAFFKSSGTWLYTTDEIQNFDQLPIPVKETIIQKFNGMLIESATRTEYPDRTTFSCLLSDKNGNSIVTFSDKGAVIERQQ